MLVRTLLWPDPTPAPSRRCPRWPVAPARPPAPLTPRRPRPGGFLHRLLLRGRRVMTQRPRVLRGREAPFGAPVAFYGVWLVQQPITARIWFAFAMSVAAVAAGNCFPDWART